MTSRDSETNRQIIAILSSVQNKIIKYSDSIAFVFTAHKTSLFLASHLLMGIPETRGFGPQLHICFKGEDVLTLLVASSRVKVIQALIALIDCSQTWLQSFLSLCNVTL